MKVLLVLLLIFISGCSNSLVDNEGSKYCEVDSDCVPVGGCKFGCYNKDDLPDMGGNVVCHVEPPTGCLCIDNYCTTQEWVSANGLPD